MNSSHQDSSMASPDLLFGESGYLLSDTERKEMIRRKGLCQTCGIVKVTESTANVFRRKNRAISNEDVWEGVCIRCNRDRVPQNVVAEWDHRNKERRNNLVGQQSARMLDSSYNHNNNSGLVSRRRLAPRRIQSERVGSSHVSRRPVGRTSSSDRRAFDVRSMSPDDTTARQHSVSKLGEMSASLSRASERSSSRSLVAALGDSIKLSVGKPGSDRHMAIISSFQKHSIKSVQAALQSLRSELIHSEYEGFTGMKCISHLENILKPGASVPSVQATAGQVLWILAAMNEIDLSEFFLPSGSSIDFCLCAFGSCIDIPSQSIPCILQWIRPETLEWGARCLHRHMELVEEFTTENSLKIVRAIREQRKAGSSALFWAGQLILAIFVHFEAPSTLLDPGFMSFLITAMQRRTEPAHVGSHDLLLVLMEVLTHILETANPEDLSFDLEACFTVASKAINNFSDEDERIPWAVGRFLAVLVTVAQARVLRALSTSTVVKSLAYAMNCQSSDPRLIAVVGHAVWKLSSVPGAITMTELRQALSILSTVAAENRGKSGHLDLSLPLCAIVCNICTLPGAKLDFLPVDMLGDAITDHPSDPTLCDYAFRGLSRILCLFPGALEIVLRNLGRPNIVVAFSVTPVSSDADIVSMVNSVQLSPFPDPMVTLLSQLVRRMGARLQYLRDEVKLRDLLRLTSLLAMGGTLKANPQVALIVRRLERIVNDQQLVPAMRADCCNVLRDLLVHSDAKVSLSNVLPALQFLSDLPDTGIDLAVISLLYAVASNSSTDRQPTSSMFTLLVRILHKHNHVDAVYESEIFRLGSGTFSALCARFNFQVGTSDIGSIAESAYKVLESDKRDSDSIINFLSALLVFCEDALDAVFESGTIVMVNDVMNDIEHCKLIQEIGCAILAKVTAVESMDMFLIILQTDGLKALAGALNKHGNNQNVRIFATTALRRLSGLSAIVPELAALDVESMMVSLLRMHDEDTCFCVNAIQVLGNMADTGEQFKNVPDSEVVDTCFDLLRSQPNATDVFYYCVAYVRLFNFDYLSTQSRNAWTNILIEALDKFLGVASICLVSFEVLNHLYGGSGVERLPAMNMNVINNATFALIDNPSIIKASLTLLSKLDKTSEDTNLFTVLIMVLSIFHENEELVALALSMLEGETSQKSEWTGHEVDVVVGTLANFIDSYAVQQRSTNVLFGVWQNYQLLVKERAEQLVPLLTLVQQTFNDHDCGSMAEFILREIEVM